MRDLYGGMSFENKISFSCERKCFRVKLFLELKRKLIFFFSFNHVDISVISAPKPNLLISIPFICFIFVEVVSIGFPTNTFTFPQQQNERWENNKMYEKVMSNLCHTSTIVQFFVFGCNAPCRFCFPTVKTFGMTAY